MKSENTNFCERNSQYIKLENLRIFVCFQSCYLIFMFKARYIRMGTWLSGGQLPCLLACEQYSTTQSSKIFKYYLAFSVLMDRRLRYFWLLAQPLNRKCQREIRVSDLHCSFPYKTISCEMKIMNSQVIIHSPLVKKISFIILTFLCAKIYTCYYFIF